MKPFALTDLATLGTGLAFAAAGALGHVAAARLAPAPAVAEPAPVVAAPVAAAPRAEQCPEYAPDRGPTAPVRYDGEPSMADGTATRQSIAKDSAAWWNAWACVQGQRQGRDMDGHLDRIGTNQGSDYVQSPPDSLQAVVLIEDGQPVVYSRQQLIESPEIRSKASAQFMARGGLHSQGWLFVQR